MLQRQGSQRHNEAGEERGGEVDEETDMMRRLIGALCCYCS